jgi:glycosyltransferase involved in cell wall biosynthesis
MLSPFIVIPAFNEEKRIGAVIADLLSLNYRDIVVVDDASTDETAAVVKTYPVHLVRHAVNLDQGAALRTGTEYALRNGAEAIVHFDADGQHQVKDIGKFLAALEAGFAVALGSRYLAGQDEVPLTKKYFIHKPALVFERLFTGLHLSDTHNGFRALSRKAAELIDLRQNGKAHATEILLEIARHNLSYTEVPVEIKYHVYGHNFRGGLRVVADLVWTKIFS